MLRPQLLVNAFEATTNLLTPTVKRCPHLGCALKWNPTEHTWDCPCHGSRFTEHGKLIDNPSTDDLNPHTISRGLEYTTKKEKGHNHASNTPHKWHH